MKESTNEREPQSPRQKTHPFALKLAAVMVGAALLLTLARKQGWIDAELVVRAYNVIMGLALAGLRMLPTDTNGS